MVSRLVACTSCLVHGLCGVWCFVSGMGRWHTGNTLSGCVTQYPRVDTSEASAIHPTYTNVCVYVERGHTLCVDKAHFPSSPRSVVSRARLLCGGSESLACKTTRLAQLF